MKIARTIKTATIHGTDEMIEEGAAREAMNAIEMNGFEIADETIILIGVIIVVITTAEEMINAFKYPKKQHVIA